MAIITIIASRYQIRNIQKKLYFNHKEKSLDQESS